MFALRAVFVASLVFVAACDSCNKKPETAAPAPDASAAAPIADAAPPDAADATADAGPKHEMSNCPTQVSGADVAISDVDGGVEIAITSKSEVATTEIRARAKRLASLAMSDAGAAVVHDHSGGGGGQFGRCTVVLRNTHVTTAEIPNGVKMTVAPKDKRELDWLRRETRARSSEAAANAQGAGSLRMAHCPSAVDGAKTAVKNTAHGVTVSVTGPADKVDEIRTRARHTADVAKKETSNAGRHTGEGSGGGGVGRCPIVVEGDTTVTVRDVTGGVEVDVSTTKDVAALQKEAKDRAELFARP